MRACVLVGFLVAGCATTSSPDVGGDGVMKDLVARVAGFEGEIEIETTVRMPRGGATDRQIVKVKGHKSRSDILSRDESLVYDGDSRKSFTLFSWDRTYMASEDFDDDDDPPAPPPPLVKTGKRDVVAGYRCDVYEAVVRGRKRDHCLTKAIFSPAAVSFGVLPIMIANDNGFPLRMIFRDPSGAVDIRIEAVRIERKPIADSEFTIPRGYKRSS